MQARHISGSNLALQEEDSVVSSQVNPLQQTPEPGVSSAVGSKVPAPRQTAQAVLRGTMISPKKLNDFAEVIRRLHIDDALTQCQMSPRKAAQLCHKVCDQLALLAGV